MNLTWRDMQHLVVRTSQPRHLSALDWRTNGVGRRGTWPTVDIQVCTMQSSRCQLVESQDQRYFPDNEVAT